jgi:hypothetical protein
MTISISERIDRLVDAWCEVRHLDALRAFLPYWPVAMDLTDDWAQVFESLKTVREKASADFSAGELEELDDVVLEVGRIVYRS